jgi:hypothetical protein
VFNHTCPGCGFELADNLNGEEFKVPPGASIYANPICSDPESLLESDEPFKLNLARGSSLDRRLDPDFTTGIRQIDQRLMLKLGQLAVLQGKPAHQVSLLLCARAMSPPGGNNEVIFIDGGNSFDTYTLLQYCASQGLDEEQAKERVHLSRAFTHHQMALLVREKLPNALNQHSARLACVSDITLLYSDPDVRDKAEALGVFRDSVRFLSALAQQTNALILVTNLESRNSRMDAALLEYSRTFAKLEDRRGTTQLNVTKHPFMAEHDSTRFESQFSTMLDQHFQ